MLEPGRPHPKPEPKPPRTPRRIPRTSPSKRAETRERTKLRGKLYPASCDRCHLEPATDLHELKRGAARRSAAQDVDCIVPIGRLCHTWITEHPAQAVAEGWAKWSWEN